jgi:DNA-binding transcriptional MerR regulator
VSSAAQFLNPSEAAKQLGVSTKALRLYEHCGLITPVRTLAGWRSYGPAEMARAREITELRALGLSLREVARVFEGDVQTLLRTLAAHEATLNRCSRRFRSTWPCSQFLVRY